MANRFNFRAWDGTKMLLPDFCDDDDFYISCDGSIRKRVRGAYEEWTEAAKGLILMQSTGLVDKDGKEIFESDVVRWSDNFEKRVFCYESAVRWGQGGWDILGHEVQGKRIVELLGEVIRDEQANVEIIGNVYEHPDLLK